VRLSATAKPLSNFDPKVLQENPNFLKVIIEGEFDYSHEMILRNRKNDKSVGVHVLTPLKMNSGETIIVNRGFTPLKYSSPTDRIKLNRPASIKFVGLLKQSQPRKFLAPADPIAGLDKPWIDAWLRVDIESMQNQLPYKVLPFYVEIVGDPSDPQLESKIIQTKSDKAEIFNPSEQMYNLVDTPKEEAPSFYPIPAFDPVIPPGRHLGYIFEWAAMGIFTILIGLIICLRPSKINSKFAASIIALVFLSGCGLISSSPSTMVASYYGPGFHGKKTASGEVFNSFDYTAAHKSLPFGTILKITNPDNNKSCMVRVNDRGPFIDGRDLDVSEQVAYELGMIKQGVAQLIVEH
jgi:cytochrome oxidase assembly protein ShyY1